MEPSVVFIGSATLDSIYRVERVPDPGEILYVKDLLLSVGGGEAIGAAYCAALREPSLLVAALGDDPAGHFIRERCGHFERLSPAWSDLGMPTEQSTVLIDDAGERTIVTARLADENVGPLTPQVAAALKTAPVAWLNPVTAECRGEYHAATQGLRCTWVLRLEEEAEIGRQWDVIHGSVHELSEVDEALGSCGVRLCVLTEGSAGGRYWTPEDGWLRYPAVELDTAGGDALGAGDAFRAGLLAGLAQGLGYVQAIELGSKCGARAATTAGGWPAAPALSI